MTCGCCTPELFRSEAGGRVFGYIASPSAAGLVMQAAELHFIGAAHIYADHAKGRVIDRPGLQRVLKVMRPGERLLLASLTSLGTKPHRVEKHVRRIEAMGYEVRTIADGFCRADYL